MIADGLGVAVSDAASGFNAIGGNFALGTDSLDDLMLDWESSPNNQGTLFDTTPPSDPQANAQAQDDNQLIKPSSMSIRMKTAPHTVGHYATMLGLIPLMRAIFSQHKCLGGRYVVATPSYIWTNMVLQKFADITEEPGKTPGSLFQLDFVQPVQKPQSTTEQSISPTLKNIQKSGIS
ncbi:hypothetical protein FAI41_04700 [Acetobacteraceae bacterium]|nr:hypothetical protein FAI41_04700 [Acetobacteraceae bacterium]